VEDRKQKQTVVGEKDGRILGEEGVE